jgi:hypothetical protein
VTALENYVTQYGPEAGPKIYQAIRSRAAYKGASTRRRRRIAALTGRPYRLRRKSSPAKGQGTLPLAGLAVRRDEGVEAA